jgi:hypothetical protein
VKTRVAVIGIAVLVVALAVFLAARRRSEKPASVRIHQLPPPSPLPPDAFPKIERTPVDPDPATVKEKPDPAAAKRALAKALGAMPLDRLHQWLPNLEAMHGGASPEFREFSRAFIAAAGDELIPLVKSLLAECASEEAKFLLAGVLGEARKPEAISLLQDLINQGPGGPAVGSALYSIGMARAPEGLAYLKSWLATSKKSGSKDHALLVGPALAAIGQHGLASFDFMMSEALARRDQQFPSMGQVIGAIRGVDAVEKLRELYGGDPSWSVKYGAALALGSEPSALEFLAEQPDPTLAGYALLAGREIPDIWNTTASKRAEIAERLLSSNGVPSGNVAKDSKYLLAASLLSREAARPLYDSLSSSVPENPGEDHKTWLTNLIAAFADQPDLDVRVNELGKAWNITPFELQRAIEVGVLRGALPGRGVGATKLVQDLIATAAVVDPIAAKVTKGGKPMVSTSITMSAVLRTGIAESSLSGALEEAWRGSTTSEAKARLVDAVLRGAYPFNPAREGLQWTHPEGFLETALRESPSPAAAFAYVVTASPATPDAAALQAIADIIHGNQWDAGSSPTAWRLIAPVIGGYFGRWGTAADIPKLQSIPAAFPYPAGWTPQQAEALRADLLRETRRAIDAIRLSGN